MTLYFCTKGSFLYFQFSYCITLDKAF